MDLRRVCVPAGTGRSHHLPELLVAQHPLRPNAVSVLGAVHDLVMVSGRRHAILYPGHCDARRLETVIEFLFILLFVAFLCSSRSFCSDNRPIRGALFSSRSGSTNGKSIGGGNSYAKASVVIIVTFLLTSWIVSAVVSLNFNYTLKLSEPLESFGFLYEKPWTRFGPYVMGKY